MNLADHPMTVYGDGLTPAQRCVLPVCNHFPPFIRDALVAASKTSIENDVMARAKAIDHAVERAKLTHPDLFR